VPAYFLQRKFVWKSANSVVPEFLRFLIAQSLGVAAMLVLMKFAVDSLSIPVRAAQFMATILVALSLYTALKIKVFKESSRLVGK